jgi:ABC-type phosphate/phosphonate transport system substrate-binding protein
MQNNMPEFNSMSLSRFIFLTSTISALFFNTNASSAEKLSAYKFSVFPYQAPRHIESLYAKPTLDFGKALKNSVLFETKSNFSDWFEEIKHQTYDIVLIQPFFFIEANAKYKYAPLARNSEVLKSIFVAQSGSKLKG